MDKLTRRTFLGFAGAISTGLLSGFRAVSGRSRQIIANDSSDTYEFKVGNLKCTCLKDADVDYPLENFFKNVPKEKVEEVLKQKGWPTERIFTPLTHLVVDTGSHRILLDTGIGRNLVNVMKKAGIEPESINTVLITHAHPDHIGGVVNEKETLNFPNAHYYVSKVEWDFWFSEDAIKMTFERHIAPARRALTAIKERVTLLEGPQKIADGVAWIPAPGHTPGHTVYAFDDKLYYTGDTVLYPIHLEHPDWLPIYDVLPEQAQITKTNIFNLVADKKALVVGQQFTPFPSLGHVVKKDNGWNWEPIA